MLATSSGKPSLRLVLAGVLGVLGLGTAGFALLHKSENSRDQVREMLEQRYGGAEAGRRLAALEASVAKKSDLGREAFWRRTLTDLRVPPEMRREIYRREQEALTSENRRAFRLRTANDQVITLPPKTLLTMSLGEARTFMPAPVSGVGDPPLSYRVRYSDGLVITADYAAAVLRPGTTARSRGSHPIAGEGPATLPRSLHFDFTLTEIKSYVDAARRLGFDRKGEIEKSQGRPRIVSLPSLPSGYCDVQVVDGYGGISIYLYRQSPTPTFITSHSQATEARSLGVRRGTP